MQCPTSGKRVYMIDASLLKESDCLAKVNFIHNEGLTTQIGNFKMDYGTAFHKFVALYNSGVDPQLAMQHGAQFYLDHCLTVPEDDFRTIDHLLMTMKAYISGPFKREIDLMKPKISPIGKPCVEMQFTFPFLSTPTYDVVLTGTADLLATYIERDVINDYKVTSVWKQEQYLSGYDLDPQLIFYSWVLKNFGITQTYLPGIITGIFIKKPTATTNVGGKRVAVNGWNGASFARSALIEFPPERIIKFERWFKNKISQIVASHEANQWEENYNCCNDIYGPCDFKSLCTELNPQLLELKKKSIFIKRAYDPTQFQK